MIDNAPTFQQRAAELEKDFAANPLIRAVNFHSTARVNAAHYERQLAEYQKSFTSVNEEELDHYLTTGEWLKSKPGLIISVFEGYRNSYDVLLPLIEKYGFIGWFSMISTFINTPIPDQLNYADHHDIDMLTHEYPDGRYAMTWDELREIDKRHVINSHSRNHTQLSLLPPDVQYKEVVGSQEDFNKELGRPVRGFVSLFGPAYGENPPVDKLIDQAGYEFVLSNYRIQRIHPRVQHKAIKS
jgi:peptidoglycan/xylan/chitin deacetylase (PgdA/CDA1 family)